MENFPPVLKTIKNGTLRGLTLPSGVRVFRGIPYAQPPVGSLRFKRPQPPLDWEGEFDATQFKGTPPQPPEVEFYDKEFYSVVKIPKGTEDCLYLNVYCPPEDMCNGDLLPVLVWIHGGAYCNGFSWEIEADTEEYAKRGIVYVTIEYRLGPFGFMVHPFADCGNCGIYDQIQALKWVQENISAFHGNKENVTLCGQSAGAMSIQILLETTYTNNLFHKVIQQSGGGFMDLFIVNKTKKQIEAKSKELIEELGVKTQEEFLAKTTDEIMNAHNKVAKALDFGPYIDGDLIKGKLHEMIERKEYKNIPILIGSLSKEFGFGTSRVFFYRMMLNQGRAQIKNNFIPCYMYYGDFYPPGDDNIGSQHSLDLWYTHGTYMKSHRPMGEKDKKLSELFISYWTNFIKTGNPNGEGLPEWTQFTDNNKKHLYITHDKAQMQNAHWF